MAKKIAFIAVLVHPQKTPAGYNPPEKIDVFSNFPRMKSGLLKMTYLCILRKLKSSLIRQNE